MINMHKSNNRNRYVLPPWRGYGLKRKQCGKRGSKLAACGNGRTPGGHGGTARLAVPSTPGTPDTPEGAADSVTPTRRIQNMQLFATQIKIKSRFKTFLVSIGVVTVKLWDYD